MRGGSGTGIGDGDWTVALLFFLIVPVVVTGRTQSCKLAGCSLAAHHAAHPQPHQASGTGRQEAAQLPSQPTNEGRKDPAPDSWLGLGYTATATLRSYTRTAAAQCAATGWCSGMGWCCWPCWARLTPLPLPPSHVSHPLPVKMYCLKNKRQLCMGQ